MKSVRLRISLPLVLLVMLLLNSCGSLAVPPSATPTPSPTQVIVQQPTPTVVIEATPFRELVFDQADRVLAFGDYQEALRLYRLSSGSMTDDMQAASLYGQGLTYYKQNDLFQAKRTLTTLISQYPDSLPSKRANFILAQISLDQELEEDALAYLLSYRDARAGILDAEVNMIIGDLLASGGETLAAQEAYRNAYLAPQLSNNTSAALKLSGTYESLGQPDLALGIYKETLYNATNDYTKASMNLLIGRILLQQGQSEEAYTFFQDSVNNYPYTYDAYTALVTLLEADQEVNELQRGMINYHVQQYPFAIEALDRYLEGDGFSKDQAMYYKGLSLRGEGLVRAGFSSNERANANALGGSDYDKQAIQVWDELIDTYPESSYRMDAIEEIIYTQNAYMGQMKLAIETALAFVAMPHIQADAADLLLTAASYYLSDGQLREAADTWTRIGIEFPASMSAFNGLFFGGTVYYEMGEFEKAAENFNRAVLLASEGTLEVPGSYFWLGKVNQAKGDQEAARLYWQRAVDSDPYGYYGIRSAELLNDLAPFAPVESPKFNIDLDEERLDAGDWLRTAFGYSREVNLDYSSELFSDSRYVRGLEYHQLGMYAEASREFEALRSSYKDDPLNSFRLIKEYLYLGYYQSAIEASRSISRVAGYGDVPLSANYPPYFAHIQYGTYYLPWLQDIADNYNLSELLIYSLIYQESRFAAHAYSTAGASGLMQLMPATAAQIAGEIGYPPDYSQSDLAIPRYNLELGSNYLARQIFVFEGNLYHALAAYNGGPGNTIIWKELTEGDPDVFLNSIRFLETRTYLRKIVEIYHIYSLIYGN